VDLTTAPGEDLVLVLPATVSAPTGRFLIFDAPTGQQIATGTVSVAVGSATFTLPGSVTAPLAGEWHVWYFECWLDSASGSPARLETGKLTVA
jgi:hypothetical protein